MKLYTLVLYRQDKGIAWSGVAGLTENDIERTVGLSRAAHLPFGYGMMFRVVPGDSFTMEPMRLPLDMVWIGRNTVVRVDRDLVPGTTVPIVAPPGSTMMLELAAGDAQHVCDGCSIHIVSG